MMCENVKLLKQAKFTAKVVNFIIVPENKQNDEFIELVKLTAKVVNFLIERQNGME